MIDRTDALATLIQRYAHHDPTCAKLDFRPCTAGCGDIHDRPCSCGLDAAIRAAFGVPAA